MSYQKKLCQHHLASLERAVIVDFEHWQAICINCYDLVAKGVIHCQQSLEFVIDKALRLAKKLNLPAVIWATNDPKENLIANQIKQINQQIMCAEQHLEMA